MLKGIRCAVVALILAPAAGIAQDFDAGLSAAYLEIGVRRCQQRCANDHEESYEPFEGLSLHGTTRARTTHAEPC